MYLIKKNISKYKNKIKIIKFKYKYIYIIYYISKFFIKNMIKYIKLYILNLSIYIISLYKIYIIINEINKSIILYYIL